ncbi:hypothetical protein IV203_003018 [Nitzschia inconspicua]|uniref:Uncharacterized protein n=1 Tax=Nitzschia inconspicua TaxID=303405 RepID=A0A9K3L142_9STRA|nr:hypothetical protein IV203_003018 [Nitzschia inconspicua]
MSQWVGNLGSLHQYRNVPYVERAMDGTVACLLCGTGWMNPNARVMHFHGRQHSKNYNRIKEIELKQERERERLKKLEELETRAILCFTYYDPRIAALGLKAWRDIVTVGLYHYLRGGELADADLLMNKYEKMESLSLLELAILKSKAVDGVMFQSTYEIRQQQALDPNFNATAYLRDQRVISGCHVIVPSVAAFL